MSFVLDPDAVLDFQIDWTQWLTDTETITSHTVTPTDGVTVDSHSESGGKVTAWLSHGTNGKSVSVTCHITTSAGRQDDRTLQIFVEER